MDQTRVDEVVFLRAKVKQLQEENDRLNKEVIQYRPTIAVVSDAVAPIPVSSNIPSPIENRPYIGHHTCCSTRGDVGCSCDGC